MATISPVLSGDYLYEARPKINTALATLNAELTGLNTVVITNSAAWSAARQISLVTPVGTPNGTLSAFTLPYQPVGDIVVFLNGLAVEESDYSVDGSTLNLTFAPISGDNLMVFLPTAYGGGGPLQFVIPTGTLDGANTSFTLPYLPTGDVAVFLNGISIRKTTDYSVNGVTLTMEYAPLSSDSLTVLMGSGGSRLGFQHAEATFDGQGFVVSLSAKKVIPVELTGNIIAATVITDVPGSIAMTWKRYTPSSGFFDAGTTLGVITLSGGQYTRDVVLSGWTTSVTEGDVLECTTTAPVSAVTKAIAHLKIQ